MLTNVLTSGLYIQTPVSEHCPLHLEEESVMTALNALLRKIQVMKF